MMTAEDYKREDPTWDQDEEDHVLLICDQESKYGEAQNGCFYLETETEQHVAAEYLETKYGYSTEFCTDEEDQDFTEGVIFFRE